MEQVLTAGTYLCVDELMCSWTGLDGDRACEGMPHVTKIARKPKGTGCEFKASGDAATGIIFFVEIQEGEEKMATKEYVRPSKKAKTNVESNQNVAELDVHQKTTACTLRLTKSYHGRPRIVVGDAWFASVATLQALHQKGLYFIGIVKTAHKNYPSAIINAWSNDMERPDDPLANRGAHKVFTSQYTCNEKSYQMMAVGWKDTVTKNIISNVGNTLGGYIARRPRHTIVTDPDGIPETIKRYLEVPQPNVVYDMFDAFPTIDIHDHLRQGILKMEASWKTMQWQHRMYATMFGIMFTNAYLAYKYTAITEGEKPKDLRSFLNELAHDLIHCGSPDVNIPRLRNIRGNNGVDVEV